MEFPQKLHPLLNNKMKRRYLWILILPLAMGSCGNKSSEMKAESASVQELALEDASVDNMQKLGSNADRSNAPVNNNLETSIPNTVKIIKRGNISLESKKITESKKNLDALLKNFNAYYEQETTNNSNDFTSYNLTIRVPVNSFDNLLTALESGQDKLTEKNISAEDVSIQYYDISSRLKSKRAYLERYQAMVSSAKNVKDLLEIQEQIRQLQEEIDSNEGILRNLSNQVNYSTLTVNLFEYQANLPMGSNSFWVKIKDSLIFGWNMIQTIVLGIIGLWPIWIVAIVAIAIIRKLRRKRKASLQQRQND